MRSMPETDEIFRYKKPNAEKLLAYGFRREGDGFVFQTEISEGQFLLCVTVGAAGSVETRLTDLLTGDPYTLHLVAEAAGAFVGTVRTEYFGALKAIAASCFDMRLFQSDFAYEIISFVRETYGCEPEYLWKKFPNNAVWRRKDNAKWFGAILTADGKHFSRTGEAEVIDLRIEPQELDVLADGRKYFRGWHMNKQHWFTVLLDGSVPLGEIYRYIERSYLLAKK